MPAPTVPRKTALTRGDVLPMEVYAAIRAERRRAVVALKRNRRVAVGPHATACFECYDTMWQQIHEMLFIEKGGERQIDDELRAYNPLIPKGAELVATLMFEIDDPVRRAALLGRLGGVERTVTLRFAGHTITARPDGDAGRTSAEGRTPAIHFLHFDFTPEQVEAFGNAGTEVVLGIGHAQYGHMAVLPTAVREELGKDLG